MKYFLFLILLSMLLFSCSNLVGVDDEKIPEINNDNYETIENDTLDNFVNKRQRSISFPKAGDNSNKGLYWIDCDGIRFSENKPTIIFIHGASGSSSMKNKYWNGEKFYGWNIGVYNWSGDGLNDPKGAYTQRADSLYQLVKKIIQSKNYNNTEIRLVGYSWGTHVASYAGRKIMEYIKNNDIKILLSVDLLDPVLLAGKVKDDNNEWEWGGKRVRDNLNYIAANQTVGIKANKKLFTIVIEKYYNGVFVYKNVMPYINKHIEVHQNGKTHSGIWMCPTFTYKTCKHHNYADTKVDLTKKYVPGKTIVKKGWLLPKNYNSWIYGPIFKNQWRHVKHDCFRFVDVQKTIPWNYWKQTGTKKIKWGGYWKNGKWHWKYKKVPIYGWVKGTKQITVKELWEFKDEENCGKNGIPHQKLFYQVWRGFKSYEW